VLPERNLPCKAVLRVPLTLNPVHIWIT